MINTIEVKDKRKKSSEKIPNNNYITRKKVTDHEEGSEINSILDRVHGNKKEARIGKKHFTSDFTDKSQEAHCYCVLLNKYGIPKARYAFNYGNNSLVLTEYYNTKKYLVG